MFASSCRLPDFEDPDEMFDSIGETEFCHFDDGTQAGAGPRENIGSGVLASNGGNNSEGARAVVIGPGGVLWVVGRSNTSNNDFLIMKYFADGSLDSSFDTDGKVFHSFGVLDDWPHAAALQTNGRLVVAGRSDKGSTGNYDFAVLRLMSNGGIDTSFSTTGKKLMDITTKVDIARAVTLQTDGMIVVAGYGRNTLYDYVFARLTTTGSLDTAFDTEGTLSFDVFSVDDGVFGVAVDSLARIIGGGASHNGGDWDFSAVRLLPSGGLDTSFFTEGKTALPINAGEDFGYGVAVNSAGEVFLGGKTFNGGGLDFAYVKLTVDGALDTAFNSTGMKTQDVGVNGESIYTVALETNGNVLVAAGYTYNGTNNDFTVLRTKSNGDLDTSFATNGKYIKAIGGAEDTAQAMAMDGDGVIWVAGRTDTGGSAFDYALVRLQSDGSLARSGQPVLSFAPLGKKTIDFNATDNAYSIQADTKGKFVGIGGENTLTNFAVARLLPNSSLDTSFHTDGKNTIDFAGSDYAMAGRIDTSARVLVCGRDGGAGDPGIARLTTGGSLDTTFHTDGKFSGVGDYCQGVTLQTDGKIVMTGKNANAYWAKLNTDGSLDTAFNTSGEFTLDISGTEDDFSSLLDINGYLLAACTNNAAPNHTCMARVNTDGSLDTSFHSDGKISGAPVSPTSDVTHPANSLSSYSDNAFYWTVADNTGRPLTLARYLNSGSLDTSFATNGTAEQGAETDPYGIVTQLNGKAVVATLTSNDFKIVRFSTDGSLDTTFNSSGSNTVAFTGTDIPSGVTILDNGWICSNGIDGNNDWGLACLWQ